MTLRPYAGAYWGPRAEPLDACTDRTVRFLRGLAAIDPALGEWYQRADRRADALGEPVPLEREAIGELLGSGRNRRDADHSVIPELGFSIGAWNGKEPSVGLRIGCGKHTPHVPNAAVLTLPPTDEPAGLAALQTARAMIRVLVECWEPDWATWTTHEWREEQGAGDGEPVVGWMTWLAGSVRPSELPHGVVLEDLGGGTLAVAADDPASLNGATLVALRRALLSGNGRRPLVPS